jgi:hypothetical protein
MDAIKKCPECGASWQDGQNCTDHFHQMLFWESEHSAYWVVHHLMVLCYHLQHPSLYSVEGLQYSLGLLNDFLINGISTEDVRKNSKDQVNSKNRGWKVTSRPDSKGAYEQPVHWTMTAADVVAGEHEHYVDNVRLWAQSVYDSIAASKA